MRRYTLDVGEREFVLDVQMLSADRYKVVVGGQHYEVTLTGDENLPAATITPGHGAGALPAGLSASAGTPQRPAPVGGAAIPPLPRRATRHGAVANALFAPMPGVILELHVKRGDFVQRGQQIAVLDAMKMHNFIGAPQSGLITEVCVTTGQAVGQGEPIVRFEPSA